MLLPANQLIDIISSDELNVRSEEQVFNAVMAWVKYSIQERRPQLPQVSILPQLLLALLAQINWLQLKLQLCSELQLAAALLHLMIDFALMHSRFCALQV